MIQQPNLIQALTVAGGTSFAGAAQGRPFLTVLDPNMVLPYSHQYNLSWERELRGSWHVQLGYTGSRAFKLIMMRSLNRGLIVPGMTMTENNVDQRRPNQSDSSIRDVGNAANAWYGAAFAFIQPGRTAGNLGRNVFRKGPIRNVNASLSRQFPVWKEKPLTIRAGLHAYGFELRGDHQHVEQRKKPPHGRQL
jgi:hypothetical protein